MRMRLISLTIATIILAWQSGTSLTAQEVKLRYGIGSVSFAYAPLYVAEDKGFFKKQGLTVESIQLAGSSAAASATISGNVQFYVGLPQTAALAIAKGEKLSTFAVVTKEYGSDIVVSKEIADRLHLNQNMPVEMRLSALKGLKIAGWTPGGSPDMLIRFIAAKMNWKAESDLTILPIGPSGPMLAALENKRVDAFVFSAPTSLEAVQRSGAFLLYSGAKGEWPPLKNEPYMCLIGNTEWLANNKDAATAVYQGLWQAMEFMKSNPAEAKELIRGRLSSFNNEAFENGYRDVPLLVPASPKIDLGDAKAIKDFVETLNPTLNIPLGSLVNEEIGRSAKL